MGVLLILFWPLLLLTAPFSALAFTFENIFTPFGEAGEVWFDYFSNIF